MRQDTLPNTIKFFMKYLNICRRLNDLQGEVRIIQMTANSTPTQYLVGLVELAHRPRPGIPPVLLVRRSQVEAGGGRSALLMS